MDVLLGHLVCLRVVVVREQVLLEPSEQPALQEPQDSLDSLERSVNQVRTVIPVLLDRLETRELPETRVPLARSDFQGTKASKARRDLREIPDHPDRKDSLEMWVLRVTKASVERLDSRAQQVSYALLTDIRVFALLGTTNRVH